ncbi:hypothetical protein NW768_007690 [Fusarium equiseti]|uniref:Uncharacterized protein n=1 Tax=Fusarium equiseti TaxID=61235 RepID=A0ABQ8R8E0_FUSEQ|nr:hypothetical protein NW768_007690 [Fusarium equiseti]
MEEALAFLDECHRPRPHRVITYEQAMSIDGTLEVPDGWDINLFGPWEYDYRYPQLFPSPHQISYQPPPPTRSRLQLPTPVSRADELRAMIRESCNPPSDSDMSSAFDTVDRAALLSTLFPALPSAFRFYPSLAVEAARLVDAHFPALRHVSTFDPSLRALLFPNETSPISNGMAGLTQRDPFPALPQGIPLEWPPYYSQERTTEADTLSVDDCQSISVSNVTKPSEVVGGDREAYRDVASASASGPSLQITSEGVFTPPSSHVRRCRSAIDDGVEGELPCKKARLLEPAVKPDILSSIKCENHLRFGDETQSPMDSKSQVLTPEDQSAFNDTVEANDYYQGHDIIESDTDSVSEDSMTRWERCRDVKAEQYTRCNRSLCLRELSGLLVRFDSVSIHISGVKPAPLTDAIARGSVPQRFDRSSLTRKDRRQVTDVVNRLFEYYSTIEVMSGWELEDGYLSD